MDVIFKVEQISKNVVRFKVPDTGRSKNELKESGSPGFGSMEIVVPTAEDLKMFEVGQSYTFSFEPAEHTPGQ